jgi:anti-anti-sigma regulatory factor
MGKDKKQDIEKVVLPSVLDIRTAKSFYDEIKAVSKAGANIVINGENVEKITTPAIQVLLASSIAACKKKGSFKVESFSPQLERAFVTIGLESQFNKWK